MTFKMPWSCKKNDIQDAIKSIVVSEFHRDIETYTPVIGDNLAADQQLDEYLNKKNFNLPIADITPILLAKGLGINIFIFKNSNNKVLINKIGSNDSKGEPILLRKTGEHYDTLLSTIKWKDKSSFKDYFSNCAILKVPFVNNKHSKEVRYLISKYNLPILVVFTPGIKLIHHLTSSALTVNVCDSKYCPFRTQECLKKNVIYELTCKQCGDIYIGETQRLLHTRLKEHLKSITMGDSKSAMSSHYTSKHSFCDAIPFSFKILDTANDFIDRKIKEATWIKLKKPTINRDGGWII